MSGCQQVVFSKQSELLRKKMLTEYLTKDTAVSQKSQQNISKIAQRHEYKLPSAAMNIGHIFRCYRQLKQKINVLKLWVRIQRYTAADF